MDSITVLKAKTTIGIEAFKKKHQIETNYQLQKKCGLSAKAVDTIQISGGITKNTLYKMGVGVGYKDKIEDFDDIVIAVMNDMTSRDLTELQVVRRANKIIRTIKSGRRKCRTEKEVGLDFEDEEALTACENQHFVDSLGEK